MENILIYNTPTSEKIIREINDAHFKKANKKYLSNNNKNLYWGIALLLIAILPFRSADYAIATFLIGYSLALIFLHVSNTSNYFKIKNSYFEHINKEAEHLNQNSKDVFWEYAPTYFRFRNYKQDLKYSWVDITYQIFDNKYLYIIALDNLCFILNKENIDEENFQKTVEYLKQKSVLNINLFQ